jgi:MFS family permease
MSVSCMILGGDMLTLSIARAYTMIPFMWTVGTIFGAAMGGFLARPGNTWPDLFPKGSLFDRFPYLLPNFVAAAYIVFAILLGAAFLKETHVRSQPKLSAQYNVSDEQAPLLQSNVDPEESQPEMRYRSRERRQSVMTMPPVTTGATVDLRRMSTLDTKPISDQTHQRLEEPSEEESLPKHGYSRAMVFMIAQLFLMSYHQMGFSALLPIFMLDGPEGAASKHSLDLRGGLGYSTKDVGTFLAVNGFVAMAIQIFILPPFINKLGVWRAFVSQTVLAPVIFVIVPFLTALSKSMLPVGVYAVMFTQAFTVLVIYPCLLIALKNATPSMSMLGQVNGLAMTMCSGARTIAPPLAGVFYSRGGSAAGWWSVGVVAIGAIVVLLFMKQPQEKTEGD